MERILKYLLNTFVFKILLRIITKSTIPFPYAYIRHRTIHPLPHNGGKRVFLVLSTRALLRNSHTMMIRWKYRTTLPISGVKSKACREGKHLRLPLNLKVSFYVTSFSFKVIIFLLSLEVNLHFFCSLCVVCISSSISSSTLVSSAIIISILLWPCKLVPLNRSYLGIF